MDREPNKSRRLSDMLPDDLPEIDLQERLARFNLSKRQQEVALYWMLDYNYKQISKTLQISEHTVRTVIATIHKKLGVDSKASLILKVIGIV
jgi:DNA-binding CsgD family transcriptional regulator